MISDTCGLGAYVVALNLGREKIDALSMPLKEGIEIDLYNGQTGSNN